jgi:chloramphenicol O-acetyltransferase
MHEYDAYYICSTYSNLKVTKFKVNYENDQSFSYFGSAYQKNAVFGSASNKMAGLITKSVIPCIYVTHFDLKLKENRNYQKKIIKFSFQSDPHIRNF